MFGSFLPSLRSSKQPQFTRVKEPTLLCNHEGESWIQPRRTWSRRLPYSGGQGVHRKMESEGHEEKCRAAIDGDHPQDEPVGQRWGKVESAFPGRRRSHSPTAPR